METEKRGEPIKNPLLPPRSQLEWGAASHPWVCAIFSRFWYGMYVCSYRVFEYFSDME